MPDDAGGKPPCWTARTQLIHLAIPKGADLQDQFFPADEIAKILPREAVLKILKCKCTTCDADRINSEGFHDARQFDGFHDEYIDKLLGHGLSLFALLIYIRHPVLIIGFLQEGRSAATLEAPDNYIDADLASRYWPKYNKKDAEESESIAKEFRANVYKFSVPQLDATYQKYNRKVVLPFLNQEMVGEKDDQGQVEPEGSYGKVFTLDIPEYYTAKLPNAEGITKFARKELNSTSNAAFWLENHNLRITKLFASRHIVRMLKAYRHGNVFNILFPCAKTNLDHFLRDPASEIARAGPLEHNPIWKEVLGLLEALDHTSAGITMFDSAEPERWIGYHFDLKPGNILIMQENNWAISDFGQASFKKRTGGSSKVTNQGGTDAYSAPEIEHEKASKKYDVWSMGCILLEVVTFLVLGVDGVSKLDQIRHTKPHGARGADSRFWERVDAIDESSHKVKETISSFMQRLPDASADYGPNTLSRQFLERILKLIDRMLTPDADMRIDPADAARRMRHALDSLVRRDSASVVEPPRPKHNEEQIGFTALKNKLFWHFAERSAVRRDANGVSLHIFEKSGAMRIVLQGKSTTVHTVSRPQASFVPVYAFRSERPHTYSSEYHFYITTDDEQRNYLRPVSNASSQTQASHDDDLVHLDLIFAVTPERDNFELANAHTAQSALTGQRVHSSYHVQRVQIYHYEATTTKVARTLRKTTRRFRSSQPSSEDKVDDRPNIFDRAVVQLWEQTKPFKSSDNIEVPEPRPRHVAVFAQKRIILVKLAKIVVAHHKSQSNGTNSNMNAKVVRFVLNKPDKTASFPITTLNPPGNLDDPNELAVAAIPLDAQKLATLEKASREPCVAIELTFAEDDDAQNFYDSYISNKDAWRKELAGLEANRVHIPK